MKKLDENIILESFIILYNRFPDLNRECDKNLIQDTMYILSYFNVYLYEHALEGEYPQYTITEDGNIYSSLIDKIINKLSKTQYKYPITKIIRNEEEIKLAKDMLYFFHKEHKNIRLHDIVLIDYYIKNKKDIDNISKEDLNDVIEFLNYIKTDNKREYHRKRVK